MPVAAASAAVFWASMTAGRLLLAHRVDGAGARAFVSRMAVVAACAWVAVLLSRDVAVAFAGVAFFGLAMSVCAPALQGFAAHPFPGSETPVMGWLATMSGGVGAVLPWTIGAVADRVQQAGETAVPGDGLTLALCGGPVFLAAMAVVVRRGAAGPGGPP
jgi:fucose permease